MTELEKISKGVHEDEKKLRKNIGRFILLWLILAVIITVLIIIF